MLHSKLQKMAIACAGFRVVGSGHHRISFDVVKLAIGKAAAPFSDYFDRCVPCTNLLPLRCHPYACKLFRINFPLNSLLEDDERNNFIT